MEVNTKKTTNSTFDKNSDNDHDGHFIRCIFFCKFHATAGPQIVTQVPNNYISKDIFDTISQYMIPKAQLQRCFVSVYVFYQIIIQQQIMYTIYCDNETISSVVAYM